MIKKALILLLLFAASVMDAQTLNTKSSESSDERFPVFPNCKNLERQELENCFYSEVQQFVYQNFKVSENLKQNQYKGTVKVLFEVDAAGTFKVLFVNSNKEDLIAETKRVFGSLPKIEPPTYNGNPTYSKFNFSIAIPLLSPEEIAAAAKAKNDNINVNAGLTELDSIVYKRFDNPQFTSHLNIPFSHSYYAEFDMEMNKVGSNNHTASKPYTYAEVEKYYNFQKVNASLMKNKTSWLGRKTWNENLAEIQGEGYWFALNFLFNVQGGISNPSKSDYTYVNTRALNFKGGLGARLNFTTTFYESQGRFADYYNAYANSIKPSGGNPAIIPGIGIAKQFKSDSYDFPLADANITYNAAKFLDLQLGYGKNFIGDGYRSLLLSDGSSPYPFFKINANFWKIKYTVDYVWLKDVRPEVTVDKTYASKYAVNHYLSWNVSNRLNLGFFESVVWTNTNGRGFDANFVNPVVFYRAVEFSSSSKSGNALLGLTSKYKWNNQVNLYAQFLIDEFSTSDIAGGEGSWKNKLGYQFGAKYFKAFNVDNLTLQLEFNHVRPYVYSHSEPITNYAHNNQSLGHQWGGNFQELILLGYYNKDRFYANTKFTIGTRGFDFDTADNTFNYGQNIYKDYDDNKPYEKDVKVGQGNKTSIFIADVQVGYLVNPATNFKFFGNFLFRNFDPTTNTAAVFKEQTTWFSVGFRSDVFNWYFDY
ncbi:gliding motility protein RemB [Flavobacterium aquicola]|uniref:Protein involved in gliding motility RemB n=1 Tax=Flavobacterium aquicola TaxID=1682742 RepID=A0A3E0EPR0_9FLAO|nr:gliding motility protein RemB [Flavobacterium aquicola]REH00208.1 protein involved in gliding motility RemB [Flavobacterium aquicola]